jgi:hypothetical protein
VTPVATRVIWSTDMAEREQKKKPAPQREDQGVEEVPAA